MYLDSTNAWLRSIAILSMLVGMHPRVANADLTAPPALSIDGGYDPFVLVYGNALSLDSDGDGRDELFVYGLANTWRQVRYDPISHGYVMDGSVPLPFPVISTGGGTPTLAVQVGTPARYKIYSHIHPSGMNASSVAIHDARTGELEMISQVAPGGFGGIPKAAVDLDGDGNPEIILGDDFDSVVDIYNTNLTRHLSRTLMSSVFAVGNFDADPAKEVLTRDGVIREFQGFELRQERQLSTQFTYHHIVGAGDIDGNGIDEVFMYLGKQVSAIDMASGAVKWQKSTPSASQIVAAARVADTDRNGRADLLIAEVGHPADRGHVVVYEGATGNVMVQIPLEATSFGPEGINAGDFDGDGRIEIAVDLSRPQSEPNRLHIYDAVTGQQEWQSVEENPPMRTVAMGDPDSDGTLEIIVAPAGLPGEGDIRLYAYDAATFAPRWMTPLPLLPTPGTGQIKALAIADIDADGHREILVGTSRNGTAHVWVIDGTTRQLIRGIPLPSATSSTVSALAVADVNRDGDVEIVVGTQPDTTAAYGRVALLDPASGAETILYSSTGYSAFSEILALSTWEHADGADIAFVDNRTQTQGSRVAFRHRNGGQTQIAATSQALGMALLDSHGDAEPEIVTGRRDGSIEVIDSQSFASLASARVCDKPIHAVTANRLPGARRGEVFFACEDRIGAIDVLTGEFRILTHAVGYQVGISNGLFVTGTSSNDARVTASMIAGVRHFAPAAAVIPALIPSSGAAVTTHWRASQVFGSLDATSFNDVDEIDLKILQQPRLGQVERAPSANFSFLYRPRPGKGIDHFIARAVTAAAESPPVAIMVIVTNGTPTISASTAAVTAQPGVERSWYVNAQDPDSDPLAYEVLTQPTKGTLQLDTSTGSYKYTARADASGQDTFAVRVFDQVDYSPASTVTITLESPPSSPPPPTTPAPSPTPASSGGGGGSFGLAWLLSLLVIWRLARCSASLR